MTSPSPIRIGLRMLKNMVVDFYNTFYSPGSGWFIITVSFAVMFAFGSYGGNAFSTKLFNIIIIPWQIAFLLFVGSSFVKFFSERYDSAKSSFRDRD